MAATAAAGSAAVAGALPSAERASVAPIVRAVAPGVVSITTKKPGAPSILAMREPPPMPDGPVTLPPRRESNLGPQMRAPGPMFSPQTPAPGAGPMAGPQMRGPAPPQFGAPGRGTPPELQGGSGVIVDAARGYILTNDHVVRGAESIEVTTRDNRRFKAQLIGRDQATDLALLRIEPDNLLAVPLGESASLEVGDFVLAVGNPYGIGQTVTSGIVSAVGRTNLGIEGYEDFIQTDASINPGSSGGALISLDGKLVGVNTALISRSGGSVGIGLAIPIDMARHVMQELIAKGEVKRGRIGVVLKDARAPSAHGRSTSASGAAIESVEPASPAAQAGLAKGDIVVAANGAAIDGASPLRNLIGLLPVGSELDLRYQRGGEVRAAKVRLEEAKERPSFRTREAERY